MVVGVAETGRLDPAQFAELVIEFNQGATGSSRGGRGSVHREPAVGGHLQVQHAFAVGAGIDRHAVPVHDRLEQRRHVVVAAERQRHVPRL